MRRSKFVTCALCVASVATVQLPSTAHAADLSEPRPVQAEYTSPHDMYFGFSLRAHWGELEREGSDYFKLWKKNGSSYTLLDPSVFSFSTDGDYHAFEGEAYIGWQKGAYALELFAGGATLSSSASFKGDIIVDDYDGNHYLTVSAPDPTKQITFKWYKSNQFDCIECKFDNDYDRREVFLGLRPVFFSEPPMPSLKDGGSLKDGPFSTEPVGNRGDRHAFKPSLFVSLGQTDVKERFSGFTDNNPSVGGDPNVGFVDQQGNIAFSYRNSVESDFVGVGAGLGVSGPITSDQGFRLGYFATVKGAIEFHDAKGRSDWTYDQIWDNPPGFGIFGCQGVFPGCTPAFRPNSSPAINASVNTQKDETVYTLLLEGGLTLGLANGIDVELGGRYRRTEVPQIIINGTDEAKIKFGEASELGAFAGLKVSF